MNTRTLILFLAVGVLMAFVLATRSLTVASMALLIAAGGYAFLYRDEASDSRKLPWQTWLLAGLSIALYLIDWLVLGD